MTSKLSPFSEHRVSTAQGRVYVREYAGHGDPMVLMHGFPDNQQIYEDLIPHLTASGRRVVAFDFLGFGNSDRPTGAIYDFRQQLDDLHAIVDALALGQIIPVAHDASGPAAINFALANPTRVSSIVLLNCIYAAGPSIRVPELVMLFATSALGQLSAAILKDDDQMRWILEFQQDRFAVALPGALRSRFRTTIARIINDNFRGKKSSATAFAQMAAHLIQEVRSNTAGLSTLSAVKVPVKMIWGEHDPYLNVGVARELLPYLPHARLDVVDAGHWLQLDRPEEVARLMLT
jgi:haloalkane dehalogenase